MKEVMEFIGRREFSRWKRMDISFAVFRNEHTARESEDKDGHLVVVV